MPAPRGIPRLQYALRCAPDTTQGVNYGSAAIGDNITIGAVMMWVQFSSVANVLRLTWGKIGGTNNINVNQRAVDGTQLRFQYGRGAGTAMNVDVATGTIAAGIPYCLAWTWDGVAFTGAVYKGTLNSPLVNVTSAVAAGSGTHDDSAGSWMIGDTIGTTASGMQVWAFDVYRTAALPTLAQLRLWQQTLQPSMPGVVIHSYPAEQGTTMALDWSGFGNSGIITGAGIAGAPLPLIPSVPSAVRPFRSRRIA